VDVEEMDLKLIDFGMATCVGAGSQAKGTKETIEKMNNFAFKLSEARSRLYRRRFL